MSRRRRSSPRSRGSGTGGSFQGHAGAGVGSVVPDHPGSGRLNGIHFDAPRLGAAAASHAGAVEGTSPGEGKALLAQLIEDATQSVCTYLHRRRTGDVALWDNRATMHRGRPWPGTQARSMVRTTISALDVDGLDQVRPS